ncbi:exported hypothetical protein [Nitrospina gracilis 3/211]|uniref:Beta-lactamase n=1 Tax=Nitrospina gracilis (strain 3/211) TaxID=1266370 RepID=M1Z8Q7_NITG3|nr:exported hypothetical protein [Nitrospina gracilis 3/211]
MKVRCGFTSFRKGHTVNAFKIVKTVVLAGILVALGVSDSWAEEDKLLKLCEEGNSAACFERGKKYITLDNDIKKAIPLFRKSCEQDYMTACIWGGIYIQNRGQQYSPEWKEAAKMFEKACEAKEDAACFNLGALKYREGRQSAALKWFRIACDMGNQPACGNIVKIEK